MATLHLTAATTVADFRKEFNEAFGSQVKVYIGNKGTDMSNKLSEAGLSKSGDFECRSSLTVAAFIERMKEDFGLKVKVYTCDEWVAALDALTLEQSGQVKKAATKADMEKMVGNAINIMVSAPEKKEAIAPIEKDKSIHKNNDPFEGLMIRMNPRSFEQDTSHEYWNYVYPNGDRRRTQVHQKLNRKQYRHVTLSKAYYLGKYPVTQGQWKQVMGSENNPSHFQGDDNLPIESVNWNDCQLFIKN